MVSPIAESFKFRFLPIAKIASSVSAAICNDLKNRYDFSYSGIKTSVMEVVRKETGHFKGKISGVNLSEELNIDISLAAQCKEDSFIFHLAFEFSSTPLAIA